MQSAQNSSRHLVSAASVVTIATTIIRTRASAALLLEKVETETWLCNDFFEFCSACLKCFTFD